MTFTLAMVLGFIVSIGLLVSVHEFGHFWVARRLGFKVLRFSIGFGKPLYRRIGRDGVEYVLAMIPLGGYVKMVDEREGPVAPEDLPHAFTRRPVYARLLVLLAGAGANFLFAILAYSVLFVHGVPGVRPVVGSVRANSIAASAGLMSGDEIVSVAGQSVATRDSAALELLSQVVDRGQIAVLVRRAGVTQALSFEVPDARRRALTEPGVFSEGIGFEFTEPHIPVVVGGLEAGGSAAGAGLQVGDEIVAVDGRNVSEYREFRQLVRARPAALLRLVVHRGGNILTIPVLTRAVPDREAPAGPPIGVIGVSSGAAATFAPEMQTLERYGPFRAILAAGKATWNKSAVTLKFLGRMVTGQVSLKNVSGPISIATYAGASALAGPSTFLDFLAIISISLGVLNLLPIPILDGGQVVYQLAEAVRGRPLSERVQSLGQQFGMAVLILLMSLAFYNDIAWRFG